MPVSSLTFKTLPGKLAAGPDSEVRRFEDGRFSCSYMRLPSELARIGDFFHRAGIQSDGVLALECGNGVPGALVLLYLLTRGYDFLLIPKDGRACRVSETVPDFVSRRLVVAELGDIGGAGEPPNPEDYLHFLDGPEKRERRERGPNREARLYVRTSGSTGAAKLAVHGHANLLQNALNCMQRLGLVSRDRIAIPVPMTHMYGLGAAFLAGLAAGACMDLQSGANLLRYTQREREFSPDVAFLTPAFAATLVSKRQSARPYRMTVLAGDLVHDATFSAYESRFGPVVQLYGSTEMGVISATNPREPRCVRAGSVGRPLPGVLVRLNEGGRSGIPEADTAELRCSHTYGFEGYVAVSSGTAGAAPARDGPWFATGDLGRINEDGTIRVLGRCDHAVNRDGLLVLLSEVEGVISAIQGVARSAVVVAGESPRGKGMEACCVLEPESVLSPEAIRSACFRMLPRHAVPDRVSILSELPTLANGKLDRPKLQAQLGDGSAMSREPANHLTPGIAAP